jgi:hypothetical protein
MPMETDTIEFTNVKGDWFSLSHSLSHDNGSFFSYENQEPNPLIPNQN